MKKQVLQLISGSLILCAAMAARADIMEDFDKLGGNDVLMEKAKALEPERQVSVVQDRIVGRTKRFEFAPEFASVVGGDSYLDTNVWGLNAHFHINPHWSIGVKYNKMYNSMSPEGQNLIDDSSLLGKNIVPEIDYPKDQSLATLNFYPIYGKLNVFDKAIAHFDVYALAGYGQINLRSGNTSTYTAGGGVGLWLSQHLTSRLELRYQTYDSQRSNGTSKMEVTVASLQFGYLL